MLFSLNVDGRLTWDPADAEDERVHRLFSQHQRRDKGFGIAMGPSAVEFAFQQMASAGYEALHTHTDWVIDGAHAPEMHFAMVEGVAVAALEQDPTAQVAVQCWRARRNAGIGASRPTGRACGNRRHARLDRRAADPGPTNDRAPFDTRCSAGAGSPPGAPGPPAADPVDRRQ